MCCASMLFGCAAGATLGVGPTLDTDGNAGFELRLSGAFGGGPPGLYQLAEAHVAGGQGRSEGAAMLSGGVETGIALIERDDWGARASVGYSHRAFYLDEGDKAWDGLAFRVGLTRGVFNSVCKRWDGCVRWVAGLDLRGEVLFGPSLLGYFSLPLTLGVVAGWLP